MNRNDYFTNIERIPLNRDLGDFQTPRSLVDEILKVLAPVGERWPRALEPTCGTGSFISGLLDLDCPPREILAFELQDGHFHYAEQLARKAPSGAVKIRKADLFRIDLRKDLQWQTDGPLLVIGNPPWVTSSELGGLSSANIPKKRNFRGLRGIDAITGDSNFDLAEHILIKILDELAGEYPTIAMLCKTQVARNVLRYAHEKAIPVEEASIRLIDARKWFNAEVDACLFQMNVGSRLADVEAEVFPNLHSCVAHSKIGFSGRLITADLRLYERSAAVDGTCQLVWRQGVKHDAASVMELTNIGGSFRNRLGEAVDVECGHVYPLLKSSDLFNYENPVPRFSVIVTQRRIGEDTMKLRNEAPKLWKYLKQRSEFFSRRKSSVYAGKPEFSMFGVGDYSFSLYKVAVAGLYGQPRFRLIQPTSERPVMMDDTCYFVPCRSLQQAALLVCLLNDQLCMNFIRSVTFEAAKRPVKKAILQRINLSALLARIDRSELQSRVVAVLHAIGTAQIPDHDFSESVEELLTP